MTEVLVRATALRWEAESFPGWLEVVIVDASGHSHRVIDKAPVLTDMDLGPASRFPVEVWLRGHYDGTRDGCLIVQLADCTTTEGIGQLNVAAGDVRWL